jgi:hypothetical protein
MLFATHIRRDVPNLESRYRTQWRARQDVTIANNTALLREISLHVVDKESAEKHRFKIMPILYQS